MLVMVEQLEALVTQEPGQNPPGEMEVTLIQTTMEDQPEQAALAQGRGQRLEMRALVQTQATAVEQDRETAPRSLVREVR